LRPEQIADALARIAQERDAALRALRARHYMERRAKREARRTVRRPVLRVSTLRRRAEELKT
jgi:alpha-ketoglutarate-dependent taurine dioxygenase